MSGISYNLHLYLLRHVHSDLLGVFTVIYTGMSTLQVPSFLNESPVVNCRHTHTLLSSSLLFRSTWIPREQKMTKCRLILITPLLPNIFEKVVAGKPRIFSIIIFLSTLIFWSSEFIRVRQHNFLIPKGNVTRYRN